MLKPTLGAVLIVHFFLTIININNGGREKTAMGRPYRQCFVMSSQCFTIQSGRDGHHLVPPAVNVLQPQQQAVAYLMELLKGRYNFDFNCTGYQFLEHWKVYAHVCSCACVHSSTWHCISAPWSSSFQSPRVVPSRSQRAFISFSPSRNSHASS